MSKKRMVVVIAASCILAAGVVVAGFCGSGACESSSPSGPKPPTSISPTNGDSSTNGTTLWEVVVAEPDLTFASDAIRAAWFHEELEDPTHDYSPLTLLVPINSAFEEINPILLNNLLTPP
jgi:hypothetical protein